MTRTLPLLSERMRILSKETDFMSQATRKESALACREFTRTQLLTAAMDSLLSKDG